MEAIQFLVTVGWVDSLFGARLILHIVVLLCQAIPRMYNMCNHLVLYVRIVFGISVMISVCLRDFTEEFNL